MLMPRGALPRGPRGAPPRAVPYPGSAYGAVLQVLRRSWGMAAFRENARLVVRRLTWVRDARASALIVNTARDRARMGRRYENAMEHHPRRVGVRGGRPSRNRGGGG